jgi:hypothetical protein
MIKCVQSVRLHVPRQKRLRSDFENVELLEPDSAGVYPRCDNVIRPDVIFFHAPALHDRKRPWNALLSALLLRRAFPKAKFVSIVHEFSEAPVHWRIRQIALLRLSHGVIVTLKPTMMELSHGTHVCFGRG